jgi:hypothetical protein
MEELGMFRKLLVWWVVGSCAVVSTAVADDLLVCNHSEHKVILVSGYDGSVLDANFITEAGTGADMYRPMMAARVGDEIWVADQGTGVGPNYGKIVRFSMDGSTWLGDIMPDLTMVPQRDLRNIASLAVLNDHVYYAKPNNTRIASVGFDGLTSTYWDNDYTGFRYLGEFDDLLYACGSNSSGSGVYRFEADGTAVSPNPFLSFGGIDIGEVDRDADGNWFVAAPYGMGQGINEFGPGGGSTPLATHASDMHPNGIAALENGNILFTQGGFGGLHFVNPDTGEITTLLEEGANFYIGRVPEPSTLALLGALLFSVPRRRA